MPRARRNRVSADGNRHRDVLFVPRAMRKSAAGWRKNRVRADAPRFYATEIFKSARRNWRSSRDSPGTTRKVIRNTAKKLAELSKTHARRINLIRNRNKSPFHIKIIFTSSPRFRSATSTDVDNKFETCFTLFKAALITGKKLIKVRALYLGALTV